MLAKVTKQVTINEDADSVNKKVSCMLKALERMYPEKKYAIFKTDILTEKKLFSYIFAKKVRRDERCDLSFSSLCSISLPISGSYFCSTENENSSVNIILNNWLIDQLNFSDSSTSFK